jgi:hypothetical protein
MLRHSPSSVSPRVRLLRPTVGMMMIGVALGTIVGIKGTQFLRDRRERCLEIADRQASIAANYRAGNSPAMLRAADWHDLQRDILLRAADRPWLGMPKCVEFPSPHFQPERISDYRPLSTGRSPTPR